METNPSRNPSEGDWAGETAILVGGGPSLRGFDWALLANRPRVIILNRAVVDLPSADVFFSEDERVFKKYAKELNGFKGAIYGQMESIYESGCLEAVPRLQVLRRTRKDKFWSRSLGEGLSYSSNSAIGATNLAEILGAARLYLFGIDCRSESRIITNYHDEYPIDWKVNSDQLRSFLSDWEHWVRPNTRMEIVNVTNPAFPSALKCFRTITFDEWKRESGDHAIRHDGLLPHARGLQG